MAETAHWQREFEVLSHMAAESKVNTGSANHASPEEALAYQQRGGSRPASVASSLPSVSRGPARSSGVRLSDVQGGGVSTLALLNREMQATALRVAPELEEAARSSAPRDGGYRSGASTPRASSAASEAPARRVRSPSPEERRGTAARAPGRRAAESASGDPVRRGRRAAPREGSRRAAESASEESEGDDRDAHLEIDEELESLAEFGINIKPETFERLSLRDKKRMLARLNHRLDERDFVETYEDGLEWVADLAEKTSAAVGFGVLDNLGADVQRELIQSRKLRPSLRRRYRLQARSGPMFSPEANMARQLARVLTKVVARNTGPGAVAAAADHVAGRPHHPGPGGPVRAGAAPDLVQQTRLGLEAEAAQRQAALLADDERRRAARLRAQREQQWVEYFRAHPEAKHAGEHAATFQRLVQLNGGVDPAPPLPVAAAAPPPPRPVGVRRRQPLAAVPPGGFVSGADGIDLGRLAGPLLAARRGQEKQDRREEEQEGRREALKDLGQRVGGGDRDRELRDIEDDLLGD